MTIANKDEILCPIFGKSEWDEILILKDFTHFGSVVHKVAFVPIIYIKLK